MTERTYKKNNFFLAYIIWHGWRVVCKILKLREAKRVTEIQQNIIYAQAKCIFHLVHSIDK